MLKDQFIIFLENTPQRSSWLVLREQQCIASGECSDASTFQNYLTHAEIIVIVPAVDVGLHQLTLPKMSQARLVQAIPYALEDLLVSEVQDLHFAFTSVGQHIHVAVVQREKMQHWIETLNQWGVQPHRFISLNMCRPKEKDVWHLFLLAEMGLLNVENDALVCDLNNVAPFLIHALQQAEQMPRQLRIYQSESIDLSFLNAYAALEVSEENLDKNNILLKLSSQIEHAGTINLLQQGFAPKHSKANVPLKTKRLSYLLCVLVASLFIYPLVSWVLLATKINAQTKQITAIYKHYFPQATSLIAPRLRMQTKLENASGAVNQNKVLAWLAKVAQSKATLNEIHLQRFSYADNHLTLEIKATTVDDIVQFQNALSEQGLNVKQQNATVDDDAVNASLLIE
jgi:general secretion pathway protein L